MERFTGLFTALAAFGAMLAALVSYLALYRNSKPHILIYYVPNPNISSFIDLVIENIGGGNAIDLRFSADIPVKFEGIEEAEEDGGGIPKSGFPMLAPGQKYIFYGGQFAGLQNKLGNGLALRVSYQYKTPIGCLSGESESFILSVNHLIDAPTRTSADQAISDALKKHHNNTTFHQIRDELKNINSSFDKIAKLISEKNKNPER
ncbi:hypothetical protein [Alcaligenes faecalis]|uniref:hypothetical protein n=1 Tax=Alcaligenes faecalis TaxID=511 RepID=UPI0034D42F3F